MVSSRRPSRFIAAVPRPSSSSTTSARSRPSVGAWGSTTRIALAFLVFRHNENELPRLEAKRREIGADRFFPRRAFIYDKDFVSKHPDFQPMQALFQETCDYLYSELTVEADGGVSPCCANTSQRWDLGRMHEIGDVRTVWNGPTYHAMRAYTAGDASAPALGRGEPILCQTCDFVEHPGFTPGPLSPLPPGFRAEGKTYDQALGSAVERIPIHR